MTLQNISAAAFGCLLLLHVMLQSEAAWSSCTPSSSNIKCNVSDNMDDCLGHEDEIVDAPVLPKPVDLTTEVFATDDGSNGVSISWRSPSAVALNATTGYLLRIYRHQSPRVGELCRYMRVYSRKSTVSTSDVSVRFTYRVDKLKALDKDYSVEIRSLPYSSRQLTDFASKYFRTSSLLTPPPLNYMEVINITADNSKPYVLTGGFRRASHYPNLAADEKYLYSSYRVLLLDNSGSSVKGILPTFNSTHDNIQPNGDEYALYSLTGIIPGKYRLQVRPITYCDPRDLNCFSSPDFDNIGGIMVEVKGADYRPRKPELTIYPDNAVVVKFQVAPISLYIIRYFVVLYTPNGGRHHATEVQPPPTATDSWYPYEHSINSSHIQSLFSPGDLIVAEVVPQFYSSLCAQRGECNVNGNCTPCARSISLDQTINDPLDDATMPMAARLAWIVIVVVVVVLVAVALSLLIYARYKRLTCSDVLQRVTECTSTQPPRPRQGFAEIVRGDKIIVCLAHAACSEYRGFIDYLRSVLENHFHFEVVTFTGDLSQARAYEDSDYTLVIYSPKLLVTWKFLQTPRQEVPMEQQHRQAVLDLLVKPQPSKSPQIIFVAFENVHKSHLNELVSRNSNLQMFILPHDLKLLVAQLNGTKHSQSFLKSMEYYEAGPLKRGLDGAIDKIVSGDSGLGEMDDETLTVCTETQHDDRFGYRTDAQKLSAMHTTTPIAEEQRFLAARQDSTDATLSNPTQPEFPTVADSSPNEYVEMYAPAPAPLPTHITVDETRAAGNTNVCNTAASPLNCRRSDDCASIPASLDSFQCSELTSSMFPARSEGVGESMQTVEC